LPLTRGLMQPVIRRTGVRFLMKDGPDEVICIVSHPVLSVLGKTVGLNDTALVFWAFREKIECAASDKYDRTAGERDEILSVEEGDL
jgi:hypothetical protein